MTIRTISTRLMKVDAEDDVVLVRRAARELAMSSGFDPFATAAITTSASELARNILVHARKGEAVLEVVDDGGRRGLRLTFRDQGPGIADIPRALAGGFSTAGSLGLGLSGSRRLVDEFHVESTPKTGTTVKVTKWTRF